MNASTIRRCAAYRCLNDRSGGKFVGDFCAPCDHAFRTGEAMHGTSLIFQLRAALQPFVLAACAGTHRWEIFQKAGLGAMVCRDVFIHAAKARLSVQHFKDAASVVAR